LIPVITEDDDTDIVSFQVEGHTSDSGSELDHFTCLDFIEANNSGNTVTNTDDCTELFNIVLNQEEITTWVMFMILS
jgi:hypothetical protein